MYADYDNSSGLVGENFLFELSGNMKILLVSVNASYMHTNLAIRDLKNYADKYFAAKAEALDAEKPDATKQYGIEKGKRF